MPPGVPVAAVGLDNAKNAAHLAARISTRDRPLHPARASAPSGPTRPGWRPGARSRSPRARRWTGPTRRRTSRRSARATFTVEAVKEREQVTDHDVAAFVDVLQRLRRARRALDPLRADVLRRARHGARAAAARGGRDRPAGRARARRDALAERAREHVDTLCVGRTHGVHAEPTTFGIKLAGLRVRGAPQRRAAGARLRRRPSVGAISRRRRHLLRDVARLRGARARAARACAPSPSPRRSSRATATPSCCRRSRWPAPGSSASPRRSATCSAPRCARSRSRSAPARRAPRRCRTSATRSRPSGSPAWRACCAATRRRRWRTSRCGTSATSRTRPPSA